MTTKVITIFGTYLGNGDEIFTITLRIQYKKALSHLGPMSVMHDWTRWRAGETSNNLPLSQDTEP